jgi:hypothetical protein
VPAPALTLIRANPLAVDAFCGTSCADVRYAVKISALAVPARAIRKNVAMIKDKDLLLIYPPILSVQRNVSAKPAEREFKSSSDGNLATVVPRNA